MADVPKTLLPHRISVEPYAGDGATGPAYGPPVLVRCLLDEERRSVRNAEGAETVSTAAAYGRLAAAEVCLPGSRVTLPDGRITWVINAHRRDDGRLGAWRHAEVRLQ